MNAPQLKVHARQNITLAALMQEQRGRHKTDAAQHPNTTESKTSTGHMAAPNSFNLDASIRRLRIIKNITLRLARLSPHKLGHMTVEQRSIRVVKGLCQGLAESSRVFVSILRAKLFGDGVDTRELKMRLVGHATYLPTGALERNGHQRYMHTDEAGLLPPSGTKHAIMYKSFSKTWKPHDGLSLSRQPNARTGWILHCARQTLLMTKHHDSKRKDHQDVSKINLQLITRRQSLQTKHVNI